MGASVLLVLRTSGQEAPKRAPLWQFLVDADELDDQDAEPHDDGPILRGGAGAVGAEGVRL